MKTKKKNKVVALLMIMVMVLSMVPVTPSKASAAEMLGNFKVVGPADFGISTGEMKAESGYTTNGGSKTLATWDEVLFRMNIKTDKIPIVYYDTTIMFSNYGWDSTGSCWKLMSGGTETQLSSVTAIGKDSFLNHEFELAISTEILNLDEDGEEDDLQIGIWFDGTLYNNQYLSIFDYTVNYQDKGHWARVDGNVGTTLIITDPTRQMPEHFTIVGPEDYGISTGTLYSETVKSYGANKNVATWDETLFKMSIETDTILNTIYYDMSYFCPVPGNTDGSWIKFNYSNLSGNSASWFEISASAAIGENTFLNHKFELAISTEILDLDKDGKEDDLRYGIWFNEKLYNETWLDIIDYTERHTDANHWARVDVRAGSTVTIKGQPKERKGVSVEEENTGDMNRVSYNNPDLYVDINFGFQVWPVVVDYDEDGILDILLWGGGQDTSADMVYYGTEEGSINMEKGVSLGRNTTQPFNPTYLYNENGTYKTTLLHIWGKGNAYEAKDYPENVLNESPYYSIPAMTGDGQELIAATGEITGSGKTIHHTLVDYDNDGVLDFIRSFDSWAEYAWGTNREGRYDENGIWGGVGNTELATADGENDTSGEKDGDPMHGYVRWYKNTGSNESFVFGSTTDHIMVYGYEVVSGKKVAIEESAVPLDVYGAPSPMFNDWDGDGDMDIIVGDFVDRFYYFENIADVATMEDANYTPMYVNARTGAQEKDRMLKQQVGDTLDKNNLVDCELFSIQMQPSAFDWDGDGHKDIIVGDEDGRLYFIKNTGELDAEGTPIFKAPAPFQTKAGVVDFSTLPSIDSVDWDGDGDEDIVFSEDQGYIGILPNLTIEKGGDLTNPIWGQQVRLTNEDGEVFRLMAGYNGSIQGPGEEKLGYSKLSVGDWDGDGVYDIISNNTWGIVMFHKGIKTTDGSFKAYDPEPIIVEWSEETLEKYDGYAPHPDWNWWNPGEEPLNKAYTKEETHCLDYKPAISSTWNGDPHELVIQWRMNTCVIDLPLDKDGDGVAMGDGLMDLVVADHEGYLSFFERYEEDGVLKLKEGQRIFVGSADGEEYIVSMSRNLMRCGNAGRMQYLLADYNGDGKLDYIQNDGVNAQVRLNLATKAGEYVFDTAANWSHYVHNRKLANHSTCPTTCDWDQDGKLELLVTSEGGTLYYLNQNRMPEDFTVIGPEDYGIPTGTLYGVENGSKDYGWSKSLDTLDKVLFKMTIKQNDEGRFDLYMTNNILLYPINNNTALKFQYAGLCGATDWFEIYASQALGTTTFVGQEYELAISTEYVDNDGDGLKTDLKLGIWINECLYRGMYYYFTDYTEGNYHRLNALRVYGGGSGVTVTSSTEAMPKFVAETFSSCGIADGTVVKGTLEASLPDGTSLDELLLTGILNPEETTEFVYPLGGDASLNIRMRDDGVLEVVPSGVSDGIWFYDKLYKTFDVGGAPAALGVGKTAFMNEEYEFTISTEYVNYDNEGKQENDLKIGLWFNGKLYGNEYFYLKNCTDKLGTDFEIRSGSEKGVTVASPDLYPFKEFTRVTSEDFGIDGTWNATTTNNTTNFTIASGRVTELATMDKVLAETTITLTHSCEMRYMTDCIDIYMQSDKIQVYDHTWTDSNGKKGWIIDGNAIGREMVFYPANAIGENAFTSRSFRLSFTTEYVDVDGDGPDDLKLGVWFDGKLYNDSYLYLEDYATIVAPTWAVQKGRNQSAYDVTLASVSGLETVMAPVITDSIEMQYQVVPNNFIQQMGSPKVTITVGDEVNVSAKVSVDEDYYTFSYPGIMVQDMDQTVTATITAGNYTEVYEISMLDYCEQILKKEASELENTAETKDLIVDLVQYASAVQAYRGISGEDLLTSKLGAKVSGYEAFDTDDADASALAGLPVVEDKLTGVSDSDAYKWKNVSLVIGNKVKIRARFTATDVSNLIVKATINGEEQEVDVIETSENGVYMVDFSDIRAYEYDETITFKFYDGTQQVGGTLSYSVNTYLNAKRDYSGAKADELKALLLAIHNYGTEAKAYQSLSAQ